MNHYNDTQVRTRAIEIREPASAATVPNADLDTSMRAQNVIEFPCRDVGSSSDYSDIGDVLAEVLVEERGRLQQEGPHPAGRGRPKQNQTPTPATQPFAFYAEKIASIPDDKKKGEALPHGARRGWRGALQAAREAVNRDARQTKASCALFSCVVDRINREKGKDWHGNNYYAEHLGVSRTTVERAFKRLVDTGHVKRQTRKSKFGDYDSSETTLPTLAAAAFDVEGISCGYPQPSGDVPADEREGTRADEERGTRSGAGLTSPTGEPQKDPPLEVKSPLSPRSGGREPASPLERGQTSNTSSNGRASFPRRGGVPDPRGDNRTLGATLLNKLLDRLREICPEAEPQHVVDGVERTRSWRYRTVGRTFDDDQLASDVLREAVYSLRGTPKMHAGGEVAERRDGCPYESPWVFLSAKFVGDLALRHKVAFDDEVGAKLLFSDIARAAGPGGYGRDLQKRVEDSFAQAIADRAMSLKAQEVERGSA
ncbi:hypothetical protein GIW81_02095 [Hyphomicrobium sp. xq]|uniref:Helix-turn-helix domain-containing protein n=1 Tax=Hyphomicrobium album TaxID=2665159 RepID=A0A6I3KK49_9HYPH|nr:hypothetical protein [Hyphomicrobium album]MTD93121.1 hypothetical protein [Hyphomicrobium album]